MSQAKTFHAQIHSGPMVVAPGAYDCKIGRAHV